MPDVDAPEAELHSQKAPHLPDLVHEAEHEQCDRRKKRKSRKQSAR